MRLGSQLHPFMIGVIRHREGIANAFAALQANGYVVTTPVGGVHPDSGRTLYQTVWTLKGLQYLIYIGRQLRLDLMVSVGRATVCRVRQRPLSNCFVCFLFCRKAIGTPW